MAEWRAVSGYEGLYEVSSAGEVRSLPKNVRLWHGGFQYRPARILKGDKFGKGYCRVKLYAGAVGKRFLVHRLVAFAFIPNLEGKPCINHKDSNPSNNTVSNLEWCTYSENALHGFAFGDRVPTAGGLSGNSKLTWAAVAEIRRGETRPCDLARKFGVHKNTIGRVRAGKAWKELAA